MTSIRFCPRLLSVICNGTGESLTASKYKMFLQWDGPARCGSHSIHLSRLMTRKDWCARTSPKKQKSIMPSRLCRHRLTMPQERGDELSPCSRIQLRLSRRVEHVCLVIHVFLALFHVYPPCSFSKIKELALASSFIHIARKSPSAAKSRKSMLLPRETPTFLQRIYST